MTITERQLNARRNQTAALVRIQARHAETAATRTSNYPTFPKRGA